jgi:hypothetical protein
MLKIVNSTLNINNFIVFGRYSAQGFLLIFNCSVVSGKIANLIDKSLLGAESSMSGKKSFPINPHSVFLSLSLSLSLSANKLF